MSSSRTLAGILHVKLLHMTSNTSFTNSVNGNGFVFNLQISKPTTSILRAVFGINVSIRITMANKLGDLQISMLLTPCKQKIFHLNRTQLEVNQVGC